MKKPACKEFSFRKKNKIIFKFTMNEITAQPQRCAFPIGAVNFSMSIQRWINAKMLTLIFNPFRCFLTSNESCWKINILLSSNFNIKHFMNFNTFSTLKLPAGAGLIRVISNLSNIQQSVKYYNVQLYHLVLSPKDERWCSYAYIHT